LTRLVLTIDEEDVSTILFCIIGIVNASLLSVEKTIC
jgi:hypothetical protein